MPAGRPLLFETPEELETQIVYYIETEKKPTLAGLAYHMGIDRQTLYNYKDRPEFFDIIKKATDYVEYKYEERLIYDSNPTGVIFALKNMGWKDKQDVEQTTTIKDERPDVSILSPEQRRVLADIQLQLRGGRSEE